MTTVTIPTDKGSRVTYSINGVDYTYTAGETVSVPDEVAALIESNVQPEPPARAGVAPLVAGYSSGSGMGSVYADDQGNLYGEGNLSATVSEHKVIFSAGE